MKPTHLGYIMEYETNSSSYDIFICNIFDFILDLIDINLPQ